MEEKKAVLNVLIPMHYRTFLYFYICANNLYRKIYFDYVKNNKIRRNVSTLICKLGCLFDILYNMFWA